MERSFAKEVELLRLGAGEVFRGEGILAVAKALLESGVSYVGGYQGAPVSHLMDVFADAQPILEELGVHFEACGSEAGAAAMLGASINYPLRGAVTWKSTVGTNVASDALSNLASAGVVGGTLIIIGEDYGEGASIIQERSHAFAMKSQMWLLDPRPSLPSITAMTKAGFELSEATNTPVFLQLRIRACHVYGRFDTQDNIRPSHSRLSPLSEPDTDYGRICLPPSTYAQERHKIETRLPAAIDFIRRHGLNEVIEGNGDSDVGIILQGGLYNGVMRALEQLGLADSFGESRLPLYVMNVTYPLVPDEIADFCRDKRAVLMVEEGQPSFIEQAIDSILRKQAIGCQVIGKEVLPEAGEYTGEVLLKGLMAFLEGSLAKSVPLETAGRAVEKLLAGKARAAAQPPLPARPPGFCTGCPERPLFSALKLVQRETGQTHIASDIGCNTFATLPPFNMGNTVLGYGLSLSSASAVGPNFDKPVITVMGDGGFWHNGLLSGVGNAVFNRSEGVLVVVDNGYSAATGGQYIPSTGRNFKDQPTPQTIPGALEAMGVKWQRTVDSYDMGRMRKTLKEALAAGGEGLRVIISKGECMLNRQRRVKRENKALLAEGRRVHEPRFGVDAEICTGDRSCIRLSGCPTLTVTPSADPLRQDDMVARVEDSCVGCGVCGEVAHAAVLCPSFYRVDQIHNPGVLEKLLAGLRRTAIGALKKLTPAPVPFTEAGE